MSRKFDVDVAGEPSPRCLPKGREKGSIALDCIDPTPDVRGMGLRAPRSFAVSRTAERVLVLDVAVSTSVLFGAVVSISATSLATVLLRSTSAMPNKVAARARVIRVRSDNPPGTERPWLLCLPSSSSVQLRQPFYRGLPAFEQRMHAAKPNADQLRLGEACQTPGS
jgi:hypothetical protein